MSTTRMPTLAVNVLMRDPVAQLRQHLEQCRVAQGRWFPVHLLAEAAHQLLAPRFVTTVVVAGVLLAAACA